MTRRRLKILALIVLGLVALGAVLAGKQAEPATSDVLDVALLGYCSLVPVLAALVALTRRKPRAPRPPVTRGLLVFLGVGVFDTLFEFSMSLLIAPILWILAFTWLRCRARELKSAAQQTLQEPKSDSLGSAEAPDNRPA